MKSNKSIIAIMAALLIAGAAMPGGEAYGQAPGFGSISNSSRGSGAISNGCGPGGGGNQTGWRGQSASFGQGGSKRTGAVQNSLSGSCGTGFGGWITNGNGGWNNGWNTNGNSGWNNGWNTNGNSGWNNGWNTNGNSGWNNGWNNNGNSSWNNGWNNNGNSSWNNNGNSSWNNNGNSSWNTNGNSGWNTNGNSGWNTNGNSGWNGGCDVWSLSTVSPGYASTGYTAGNTLNYATNSQADYDMSSDYRVPGMMSRAPVYADIVVGVQRELRRRGFYRGVVNGLSDATTRAAVRSFETSIGVPATGIIGIPLIKALRIY